MSSDPLDSKTCPIETSKLSDWACRLLLLSLCFGVCLFGLVFSFSSPNRNRDVFSLTVLSSGDAIMFSFSISVCMHTFPHLHVEALSTSVSCNKQCFFRQTSFSVPSVKSSSIQYRLILIVLGFFGVDILHLCILLS